MYDPEKKVLDKLIEVVYDLSMASITKKRVGSNIYYYARECKRVNGRPKIVWQKYLGRVDDIVEAVGAFRDGLPQPIAEYGAIVTELGAVAALYDLCCRLQLAQIIDRHVPKRGKGPSVGTYLMVATINRCVDPRSKARIAEWFEQTALRRLVDIESRQLTSQRYWDNMDRVSEEMIREIEADLTKQATTEFDLDLNRLLFDGTNFFTFIDTFNERSELAQRGKSKEGRAALRIIGLALLVTADFHVPVLHETYPGNQADAPTFASLTERLVSRCRLLTDKVNHITLVFDKGNNSKDNLDAVEEAPFHFVGSLISTQFPDLLEIGREQFLSLEDDGLPGVLAYRTTKKVFGHQRTVVVTFNDNLFITQSQTLLREVAKRQQNFRDLVTRLKKWRDGAFRGKRPSVEVVKKKVRGWLKAQHMDTLFNVKVSEHDGLPSVSYHFDQDAWDRLQKTRLGKTILFTDNDAWSTAEIVRAYRSQHHVEAAIRDMKDPHHIALRPQRHWTDQKVRVHVFTCVVALMLLTLMRRELHRNGVDLSITRMMELLGGIKEIVMAFPPAGGADERPTLRTTLTKMSREQRQLFDLLQLGRYTST